jgi:hypothetical protein
VSKAVRLGSKPQAMELRTMSSIPQLDISSHKDKACAAAAIITSLRDATKNATSQISLVQVKTEKQRLKSGTIVHSINFVLKLHGCPTSYSKLHFLPIKYFLGLMAMNSSPLVLNGKN